MTADTVGGVWTYALELCRALSPQGVSVTLATMGAPLSPSQRAAVSRLTNVDVRESTFRLEWMDDPWEDVARAGDWLLDLERDTAPDVVHLNGYAHGALPFRAPKLVVAHSCVLSWWRAVKGEDAPPSWLRYRDAVRTGLLAAREVVAPTRAMLDALRTHYGVTRGCVVPNGVDPAPFRTDDKEPFVLGVGRLWDEAKNVSALVGAAPRLPCPVYVAGNADHPDGRRRTFGNVQSLGVLSQPELADWFARAAVFAHPARYEPFGLAPVEAALSGCALVLGDIASLREVWADAALFVPPDDAGALAQAIRRLIDEPPLRRHLASHGRERALQYAPETMATRYVALYDALRLAEDAARCGS